MDWEFIVSISASLFTIGLFATNFLTVNEFKKNGTTYPKPFFPFLATFINCAIWAKYGILLGNSTIYIVNGSGLAIMTFCLLAFYYFAEKRSLVEKHSVIGYLCLIAYLLFVKYDHSPRAVAIVGMTASVTTCIMFGSPLLALVNIIKAKDASAVSFPLAVMSLIVAGLWTIYGFQLSDFNIILPNAIGTALSLLQVVVCMIYRKPASKVAPNSPLMR